MSLCQGDVIGLWRGCSFPTNGKTVRTKQVKRKKKYTCALGEFSVKIFFVSFFEVRAEFAEASL